MSWQCQLTHNEVGNNLLFCKFCMASKSFNRKEIAFSFHEDGIERICYIFNMFVVQSKLNKLTQYAFNNDKH